MNLMLQLCLSCGFKRGALRDETRLLSLQVHSVRLACRLRSFARAWARQTSSGRV